MKLFERHDTKETLDRLPEMPPGVEVPDDISGLHPPATEQPTSGGVRWMRWLAAILLLGAAGVVAAVVLTSGDETDDVDYMQMYGTDNPTFVEGTAGPGTVEIVAPDSSFFEMYGTDNPVIVPGAPGPNFVAEDYMALYGTDNPDFLPEPSYMDLYGTDNPTFVAP